MNLSIIIPTLGINDILMKTLYLLNFQENKDFDVFVVDSSLNSDFCLSFETKYKLNYVNYNNYIGNARTKAFARNLGIYLSKSEYILFIDSDMVPHPDLVNEHLKFLKFDVAVVGLELRTILLIEYQKIKAYLDQVKTKTDLEEIFLYNFSNRSRKVLKERKLEWYKFLTGNLSAKREFFIKTGFFDTNFVSYGFEDLELGYRFDKLGIDIIFNPNALTIHMHPLLIEKRIENKVESVKNLRKFYEKYENKRILEKLGINFYSNLIYGYLPEFLRKNLCKLNKDYLTNYNFWKAWNTKN